MCHQFLSLEAEAENDNDLDRTLDNSGALEDSNNGEDDGGGGDSWISFDQFRRSFSSEFSQQPQEMSNQVLNSTMTLTKLGQNAELPVTVSRNLGRAFQPNSVVSLHTEY